MAQFLAVFNTSVTADQVNSTLDTVTSNNGTVQQVWGCFAMVADGEQAAQDAVKASDGVALVSTTAVDQPESLNLGDDALAFVTAWNTRQSDEYQGAVSEFLGTTVSWSDVLPPNGCYVYGSSSAGDGGDNGSPSPSGGNGSPLLASVATPSSNGGGGSAAQAGTPSPGGGVATATALALQLPNQHALVGTVAVGVAIIDGPASSVAVTTASERANMVLGAMHAFDALYKLAPPGAHLVFTAEMKYVQLDVDPTTVPAAPAKGATLTTADFESRESIWRDAALTKLGYSSGAAGMKAWAADIKASNPLSLTPDWAYLIVFTKYNAAWMGYTNDLNDPVYMIIQYQTVIDKSTGGWGLEQMHMVIAHESGHMTGAPDEYASSSCTTGGKFGYSDGPNTNCENGNASPVNCIMRHNSLQTCVATTGFFGWVDSNADGVLDPYDPTYVRP